MTTLIDLHTRAGISYYEIEKRTGIPDRTVKRMLTNERANKGAIIALCLQAMIEERKRQKKETYDESEE